MTTRHKLLTKEWIFAIPFFIMHLTPIMLIWAGFSWEGVALCVASYFLRMFGVTAGYHRYFSHRTYQMNRFWQFWMAFLAQTSAQKGVLWWSAHHRHHHRYSDEPNDVHSPKQHGFWYSHMGWLMSPKWQATETKRVRDLAKYPELRFLNKHYLIPPIIYAVAIFFAFGFHGLVWGFFVSTIFLFHGTFTVNSLNHVIGHRNYQTTDTSTNHWFLALITMGEGWHNNHHFYQRSTAQGWRWYEYDMSYMILKFASFLGITKGVSKPPKHVIQKTQKHVAGKAQNVLESLAETALSAKEAMAARMATYEEELGRKKEETQEALAERLAHMQEEIEALYERAQQNMAQQKASINVELDKFAMQAKEAFEKSSIRLETELADLKESYHEALEQWQINFHINGAFAPALA